MSQANETTTTDPASGDRLLRAGEAAEILGCSSRTIWKLRSEGKLKAVAIGSARRFRLSDVQRIVSGGVSS